MSGIIQFLFFSVWLLSLTVMSSSFLHVVASVRVSFFFKAEYYSVVYTPHLFIPSSVMDSWVVFPFW